MLQDERSRAFKSLASVATQAVESWRKDNYPIIYKCRSDDEMKEQVRFFLGRLRKKFIPIKLANLNKNRPGSAFTFARFEQAGWMDKAEERCKEKGDILNLKNIMRRWDPHDMGTMSLHLLVSDYYYGFEL
jgi:hypothetical protein